MIRIAINALLISISRASTQMASRSISGRLPVRTRHRGLADKVAPYHAAEREVGGDDAEVKLGVGPDGGDGIVVREVCGLDAERGGADYGDDGGDQAK